MASKWKSRLKPFSKLSSQMRHRVPDSHLSSSLNRPSFTWKRYRPLAVMVPSSENGRDALIGPRGTRPPRSCGTTSLGLLFNLLIFYAIFVLIHQSLAPTYKPLVIKQALNPYVPQCPSLLLPSIQGNMNLIIPVMGYSYVPNTIISLVARDHIPDRPPYLIHRYSTYLRCRLLTLRPPPCIALLIHPLALDTCVDVWYRRPQMSCFRSMLDTKIINLPCQRMIIPSPSRRLSYQGHFRRSPYHVPSMKELLLLYRHTDIPCNNSRCYRLILNITLAHLRHQNWPASRADSTMR
jgi:hypothetical protein